MKSALPEEANDASAILIGVTPEDMYIQSYDWRYAINWREEGHLAVVSTPDYDRLPSTSGGTPRWQDRACKR